MIKSKKLVIFIISIVLLIGISSLYFSKKEDSGKEIVITMREYVLGSFLNELSETPYSGVGKPEALKSNLSGFWSRQINPKDRLIYTVNDDLVVVDVISAMGHYSDK